MSARLDPQRLGPRRPAAVVVVAVLACVAAVIDILAGVVLVLVVLAGGPRIAANAIVLTLGIASIIIGVAVLVVAIGLLRGNPVARVTTIVVELLSVAATIVVIVLSPDNVAGELPGALIALLVVLILFRPDVRRYFRGLAIDEPAEPHRRPIRR